MTIREDVIKLINSAICERTTNHIMNHVNERYSHFVYFQGQFPPVSCLCPTFCFVSVLALLNADVTNVIFFILGYKTRMCHNFETTGVCDYDEMCHYAHGQG